MGNEYSYDLMLVDDPLADPPDAMTMEKVKAMMKWIEDETTAALFARPPVPVPDRYQRRAISFNAALR